MIRKYNHLYNMYVHKCIVLQNITTKNLIVFVNLSLGQFSKSHIFNCHLVLKNNLKVVENS